MPYKLVHLRLDQIRRCPIQLRKVQKETMKYMMLRDSIRDVGVLMPILVRPAGDCFEVVAGNHRFECSLDLRLEAIPCIVRDMTDAQVDDLQVIEESNRIETSPIDYYRRLQKIIHRGSKTVEELAGSIHKHPDWVRKHLRLNYLSPNAKKRLDKGELSVIIGVELAHLPIDRQDQLLSLHSEYPATEYLELLRSEVRDFRGGRKQERVQQKSGLGPSCRQWRQILDEYLNPTVKATFLTRRNAKTASEGWDACLQWVASDDPETVAEKEARKERENRLNAKRTELRNLELSRRKMNEH